MKYGVKRRKSFNMPGTIKDAKTFVNKLINGDSEAVAGIRTKMDIVSADNSQVAIQIEMEDENIVRWQLAVWDSKKYGLVWHPVKLTSAEKAALAEEIKQFV